MSEVFALKTRLKFTSTKAKHSLLGSVIVAALTLSGCSFAPNPTPNAALVSLASQALADATLPGEYGALRSQQAEALYTEVARVCGFTKTGEQPESCVVEKTAATSDPQQTDPGERAFLATQQTLIQAAALPQDSLALVSAQTVELAHFLSTAQVEQLTAAAPAATAATTIPGQGSLALTDAEIAAVSSAYQWYYAVIFGMGVALAHAGSQTAAVNETAEILRDQFSRLEDFASDFAEATAAKLPVAEPAYQLGAPITSAEQAASFAQQAAADAVTLWQHQLEVAATPAWRNFCLKMVVLTAS